MPRLQIPPKAGKPRFSTAQGLERDLGILAAPAQGLSILKGSFNVIKAFLNRKMMVWPGCAGLFNPGGLGWGNDGENKTTRGRRTWHLFPGFSGHTEALPGLKCPFMVEEDGNFSAFVWNCSILTAVWRIPGFFHL